jgi:hypothetical protein
MYKEVGHDSYLLKTKFSMHVFDLSTNEIADFKKYNILK